MTKTRMLIVGCCLALGIALTGWGLADRKVGELLYVSWAPILIGIGIAIHAIMSGPAPAVPGAATSAAAGSAPASAAAAGPPVPARRGRGWWWVGTLVILAAAIAAGLGYDYEQQTQRIRNLEDRADRIKERLAERGPFAASSESLRGLWQELNDDIIRLPDRWIGARKSILRDEMGDLDRELQGRENRSFPGGPGLGSNRSGFPGSGSREPASSGFPGSGGREPSSSGFPGSGGRAPASSGFPGSGGSGSGVPGM